MLNKLRSLFAAGDDKAHELYGNLVACARNERFYAAMGVPDTLDGRYDMLVLHAVLLFHRLRRSDAEKAFAQEVFDAMFKDMDRVLRETGVGDLSVPKRMKKLAETFYGRAEAYDRALQDGDRSALADIIARNVHHQPLSAVPQAEQIADYVLALVNQLHAASFNDIRTGRVTPCGVSI